MNSEPHLGIRCLSLRGLRMENIIYSFCFHYLVCFWSKMRVLSQSKIFFFHSWVKVQFIGCITADKGNHHIARSRTFIERCCNILVQTHGNETVKLKNWGAFDWTAHRKGTEHMISHHDGDVNCRFSIYLYLFFWFYSDSAQSLDFEQLPLVIVFPVKGSWTLKAHLQKGTQEGREKWKTWWVEEG